MSLEDWKAIFEIGGVVLLFLTFLFGAGALLTSTRINARQAVQLREFEKRLTDAKIELAHQQERAANAERALLELQTRLAHRRISQSDHDRFVASLQPYKGSVVDLTEITDLEAAQFAKDIIAVLRDAGWKVNVGTMSLGAPRYKVECFLTGASEQGEALAAVLRNLPTVRIIPYLVPLRIPPLWEFRISPLYLSVRSHCPKKGGQKCYAA